MNQYEKKWAIMCKTGVIKLKESFYKYIYWCSEDRIEINLGVGSNDENDTLSSEESVDNNSNILCVETMCRQ